MPNPKRRHSKQRTAKRRSHDFLTPTGLSECPNCHERKLPHRACRKCGDVQGPRHSRDQGSKLVLTIQPLLIPC